MDEAVAAKQRDGELRASIISQLISSGISDADDIQDRLKKEVWKPMEEVIATLKEMEAEKIIRRLQSQKSDPPEMYVNYEYALSP